MGHPRKKLAFHPGIILGLFAGSLKLPELLLVQPEMQEHGNAKRYADDKEAHNYINQQIGFCFEAGNGFGVKVGIQAERSVGNQFDGRQYQHLFSIEHEYRKQKGKYEEHGHAAVVAANAQKQSGKQCQENNRYRYYIAELVLSGFERIPQQEGRKRPRGDIQREVEHSRIGKNARNSGDQAEEQPCGCKYVIQPDAKLKPPAVELYAPFLQQFGFFAPAKGVCHDSSYQIFRGL